MSQYGILVDYEFCTGCYACEVACQSEHDMPLGQWGVKVLDLGPWPIKDAEGQEAFLCPPLSGCLHEVRPRRRADARFGREALSVFVGSACEEVGLRVF